MHCNILVHGIDLLATGVKQVDALMFPHLQDSSTFNRRFALELELGLQLEGQSGAST